MKLLSPLSLLVFCSTVQGQECGSVVNNTLTSPGYPGNYPNNAHCLYKFRIPSGKALKINFEKLVLEEDPSCGYDYLKITDDNNVKVGQYCGNFTGKKVFVAGNYALLTFHSDDSYQEGGFRIFFNFVQLISPCQKLALVSSVRVSPSHCLSSNQSYGSTCNFSCAGGYHLKGPSSTRCGILGAWSEDVNTVGCYAYYTVIVTTSNIRDAGTDADVWMKIYGDRGETRKITLDDRNRDDNQKGSADHFTIEARDVGRIRGVKLRRDNSGKNPSWHLDKVAIRIVNITGYRETYYGDWVKANEWFKLSLSCPKDWVISINDSKCYKFFISPLGWNSAKFACEALGSKLAVVNSQAKQKLLTPKVGGDTWIGLHRDPKNRSRWLWVDGSRATYTHWYSGEPNDGKGSVIEDCVEMYEPVNEGKWNDRSCKDSRRYVCEISESRCESVSLGTGVHVSPHYCLSSSQDYGEACNFSCASGYQLSGPSYTRCEIGGAWSEDVNKVSCIECQDALGMESGAISDGQISASSQWDASHATSQGRLNLHASSSKAGSWSAGTNDVNQWLQVDLGNHHTAVTRVATQGGDGAAQWVTKYKLQYSYDGVSYQYFMNEEKSADKEFAGNTDPDTAEYHYLNPPIRARYIRFRPTAWHGHISMRVELYGCTGNRKFGHWSLDGTDSDVRYFGPVNFTEGWCPGSKAAYFSENSSYATVPNINITNCDFTIAFWMKSTGTEGTVIALWSNTGKLFYATIKSSVFFLSVFNRLEKSDFKNNDWNHIVLICEQLNIKAFVNGQKRELQERRNKYFFLSTNSYEPYYVIGNSPVLSQLPLVTHPFAGSVMDLYVVGKAFSDDEVTDLFKGKPLTPPVINNKEMEINGCNVNFTWIPPRDSACPITSYVIHYREVKTYGNIAGWSQTIISDHEATNNFFVVPLDCGKEYEIAVSARRSGKWESDWSTSWRVKTNSVPIHISSITAIGKNDTALTVIITASAVALVVMVIVGIICYNRSQTKNKRRTRVRNRSKFDIVPLLLREVPPERVTFMEELGRGAFGKVHKGVLREFPNREEFLKPREERVDVGEGRMVAIKVLLERTGEEGRRQFLQEIELMKEIGTHRNVMSMLGYWVKSGPIMLILEYVPHGDLLQWLRNKRHQLKLQNSMGVDILGVEEMAPPSIEGRSTSHGDSKIRSDVENKEGSRKENVKEDEEPRADEQEGFHDSHLSIMIGSEGTSHPYSSHRESNEISVVIKSEVKVGDEKGRQKKEEERPKVKEEIEKTNMNSSSDISVSPQENISWQANPWTVKRENECKKQPVVSTLAVPLIKFGGVSRIKEAPIPPAPKEKKNVVQDEGVIQPLLEKDTTEVKITIQHEDADDQHGNDDDDVISADDILCFAWQITQGMNYLASKGFVHRDLAARNVLLGEGRAVKIADFGLLRHTSDGDIYEVQHTKKLPIKWTAPEALQSGLYSLKSDVWSFGVLLWELATMGGNPYPGISNRRLYNVLKTGYRMEQPNTCGDDMYKLMLDCWKDDPDERPPFAQLISTLEKMMTADTPYYDFSQLDETEPYYSNAFANTSKTVEPDTKI